MSSVRCVAHARVNAGMHASAPDSASLATVPNRRDTARGRRRSRGASGWGTPRSARRERCGRSVHFERAGVTVELDDVAVLRACASGPPASASGRQMDRRGHCARCAGHASVGDERDIEALAPGATSACGVS